MHRYNNEQEVLEALERQALLIEQKVNKGALKLEDINEELNGKLLMATHNLRTLLPVYLSEGALNMINMSYEGYVKNMDQVIKSMHFPGSYERNMNLVKNHLKSHKSSLPISFIQRMRIDGQKDFKGYYTLSKKNVQTNELFNIYIPVNNLIKTTNKILRILDDEIYVKYHYDKFASLTVLEKHIITLLALSYQNNEIAEQLSISQATLEQHRRNLKHKLEIKRFVDLIRFAQAFDLI